MCILLLEPRLRSAPDRRAIGGVFAHQRHGLIRDLARYRSEALGTIVRERLGQGARAAVARKLAVLMLAMWKQGSDYDPEFIRRAPPDDRDRCSPAPVFLREGAGPDTV